jgi:CubicO group peptidase (beta-lactamase class C family)
MTRRNFVKLAAAAPFLAAAPASAHPPAPADQPAPANEPSPDDSLRAQLRLSADLLGLSGFVAGVVRDGKLAFVQAEGFADLAGRTPMRRDHIFYLASVTKTFTAVMMMQYAVEKKISLDDYLLDYPFLSIGFTPDRLFDPNVKLKHVLSHTSEGKPGDQYVYSGGRYNFVYGVFEQLSGNTTHHQACAQEFRKRVAEPLGMTSTLPGYPTDPKDPRIPRITTPYFQDAGHKAATKDAGLTGATTLFPGTGMLSTVDDLAKYMTALDENVLLPAEGYTQLTTPFVLKDGRHSPYGLGWATQKVSGRAVHWHYGFGDSYSALLVRVPEKKTSFIFLSNSGAASAPFLLGFGNVLTSAFAVAFLDAALPGALSAADKDYAQAFLLHYAETALGRDPDAGGAGAGGGGGAKGLLTKLRSAAPERFRNADRALIALLADRADPAFSAEMDGLAQAYRASGDFHPDVSMAVANYYEKVGERAKRDAFLRQVADRAGYGELGSTRDACVKLGTDLLRSGKTEEGRRYLWTAARYAQTIDPQSPQRIVQSLKG